MKAALCAAVNNENLNLSRLVVPAFWFVCSGRCHGSLVQDLTYMSSATISRQPRANDKGVGTNLTWRPPTSSFYWASTWRPVKKIVGNGAIFRSPERERERDGRGARHYERPFVPLVLLLYQQHNNATRIEGVNRGLEREVLEPSRCRRIPKTSTR